MDWVGSSNPPQWWVGDWWIFGHKCGDRTKQLKSEDWDGPASDTCVHAGTTCRAFKSRRRRRLLPFKHHAVLSSLKDPELADELLDWCEAPLKNGRNRAKSGGQLFEVLKVTQKIEPEHLVLERLAELSASVPARAVECLALIVEGDREGWSILGWRGHVRTIIATAINSADEKARRHAATLVHHLGTRGNFEFRDLLPPNLPSLKV